MKKNTITNKYEAYYGLPSDVVFCNDCHFQSRPSSTVEFLHSVEEKKEDHFNNSGVCTACEYHKVKQEINWKQRKMICSNYVKKLKKQRIKCNTIA